MVTEAWLREKIARHVALAFGKFECLTYEISRRNSNDNLYKLKLTYSNFIVATDGILWTEIIRRKYLFNYGCSSES